MMNRVDFVARTEQQAAAIDQSTYAPRKSTRKYRLSRWFENTLQSLVFDVAKRFGWHREYQVISYKSFSIDTTSVMERVVRQHNNLLEFYQQQGGVVLIGPEHLNLLAKESVTNPIPFFFNYHWTSGQANPRICGMRVVVVPWMTGVLVVPESVLEKKGEQWRN